MKIGPGVGAGVDFYTTSGTTTDIKIMLGDVYSAGRLGTVNLNLMDMQRMCSHFLWCSDSVE